MRKGAGSAVQQTLTTEAASVLKHSLCLARRRGHAQVTPLHVAAILLSSRVSLLRRACLKSQPNNYSSHHPLQCRTLELCFNVALNRLPTSPGTLLHGQPCLSNAIIAALKRAQAHQRRGCIEQQQQQPPLLAIKVELEQIILSILDDPSVSRVMREAGFSSAVIKNNIEESASSVFQCCNNNSGGIFSTPSSPLPTTEHNNPTNSIFCNSFKNPNILFSPHKFNTQTSDVKLVIDVLLRSSNNKRRNTVIVGDSVSSTEGLVAELMGKVERGDVPEELKAAHFIKFQFSAAPLMLMKREEVELNISNLKRKVEALTGSDLKWTVETSTTLAHEKERRLLVNYSPVDHLVAEIGRLVSSYNSSSSSNAKVSLVATANYQTYVKCQMKQPPLEIQWSLQAIYVSSGGLGLSLNSTSVHELRIPFSQEIYEKKPVPSKEEQDALTCCTECTSNYEREARSKFGHQKTSTLYSLTGDIKRSDKAPTPLPDWLIPHSMDATNKDDVAELKRKWSEVMQKSSSEKPNQRQISSVVCNEYNSNILTDSKSISTGDPPSLKPNRGASTVPRFEDNHAISKVKITLALGNSQIFDIGDIDEEMLKLLQENLPWQMEIMHSIVDVLMDFSPMKKQQNRLPIQGNDSIGKQRLARVIAKSAFGSNDLLLCMHMRMRENHHHVDFLKKALRNNEKLIVLLPKFLMDAYENGSPSHLFILSRTSDATYCGDGREYYKESVIRMKPVVSETKKPEWELSLPNKTKSPRNNAVEDVSSIAAQNGKMKKEFTRQLSSNTLDLNIKATSPISSEPTRDTPNNQHRQNNNPPLGFFNLIKNRLVLKRDSSQDKQMREVFMFKMRRSPEEVCGSKILESFHLEEMVLEKVFEGCGSFLNSLFDEWLKDIFQTSLRMIGEKENVSIKLCEVVKANGECGFKGSCLPKGIQVSIMD
ncbi:unnamed protein product [Withania somnifera]